MESNRSQDYLKKRDKQMMDMIRDKKKIRYIAEQFGVSIPTVAKILHDNGGRRTVMDTPRDLVPMKPPLDMLIELSKEPDEKERTRKLNLLLSEANEKLVEVYSGIIEHITSSQLKRLNLGQRMRYLSVLAPIVKKQVRQAPKVNVFISSDKNDAEKLKNSLLKYVQGENETK